jgi:hypothetical protein
MQPDSVAGEALFFGLAARTVERQVVHGTNLGELPQTAPPEPGQGVLYQGCGTLYSSGLYALPQLVEPIRPQYHPFPKVTPRQAIAQGAVPASAWSVASYVVQEVDCPALSPPGPEFTMMGAHDGFPKVLRYFVRTAGIAEPLPAT